MDQTALDESFAAYAAEGRPIFSYSTPQMPKLMAGAIRTIERLSGRKRFERLYRQWQESRDPGVHVFTEAVRMLGFQPQVPAEELAKIPATGGLLVVANHPFGIADGLTIGHLIAQVRGDVKLICHSLLCDPVEARDVLLPIDFGPGAEARRTSAETRRRAQEWLDEGHVVILFPAGGVATSVTPFARTASDFLWHPFAGRLARRAGVQTLPIYVEGRNSRLFQVVSHYSYTLRIALIFHETRRRLGKPVGLRIGSPVRGEDWGKDEVVGALRAMTYALAEPGGPRAGDEFRFPDRVSV